MLNAAPLNKTHHIPSEGRYAYSHNYRFVFSLPIATKDEEVFDRGLNALTRHNYLFVGRTNPAIAIVLPHPVFIPLTFHWPLLHFDTIWLTNPSGCEDSLGASFLRQTWPKEISSHFKLCRITCFKPAVDGPRHPSLNKKTKDKKTLVQTLVQTLAPTSTKAWIVNQCEQKHHSSSEFIRWAG